MLAFLFAILQVVAAADPAALPAGRLCIGETKSVLTRGACRDVKGTTLAIEPADRERLFVWTSAGDATAQIGIVPTKSTAIELKAEKLADVYVTFDAPRGWPANPMITVAAAQRWEWELAEKLRLLIVPRGIYSIQVEAEHHRPAMIRKADATGDAVKLAPLTLSRLPQAKGRVIDKDNTPVAGAQISFVDGDVCTVTNVQGEFTCELALNRRSRRLMVMSGGYAAVELAIQEGVTRDVDLGDIRLLPGQPLIVKITRPDELTKVKVTLLYDSPGEYEHAHVRTAELPAAAEQVRFDEVTTGDYHLLLQGAELLERLLVPVRIEGEGPVTKEIALEPFRLEGTARFGDEAIDGTLTIRGPEMSWEAAVPIKEGAFEETMWQPGVAAGFLKTPVIPSEEFVVSPKLGQNPSKWDIRIERRLISGRVFDAETKGPVREAEMDLITEIDGGRFYQNLTLSPDGSFEILASKPGLYTLTVTSPAHAPWSSAIKVGAEDKSRSVEIALDRGVDQPIEVLTPAGAPVASFMVLEGVHSDRHNPKVMMSATNGRFTVRGVAGESRLIYVIPRDGSFAIVRLQMPRRDVTAKPIQVVVPPGTSALRVRAVDSDKKPVPAGILVRYNGEFLPGAIGRFVNNVWFGTPASGEVLISKLPAGVYELWALASASDEEQMIASGGTLRPPARVGLSNGEQTVVLVAPRRAAPPGP